MNIVTNPIFNEIAPIVFKSEKNDKKDEKIDFAATL